jgi:hypothetical protein
MNDQEIDGFFDAFVYSFMCGDVERCIAARANQGVALMLLSYTEVMGGLSTGNLGLTSHSTADFRAGLSLMEWNGHPNYYRDFRVDLLEPGKAPDRMDVYKIFRCGVAHEYFVKGLALVHNNPDRVDHCIPQDKGIGWIDHAGTRILRFHTNAYYRDFRAAMAKLHAKAKTDPAARAAFSDAVARLKSRSVQEVP